MLIPNLIKPKIHIIIADRIKNFREKIYLLILFFKSILLFSFPVFPILCSSNTSFDAFNSLLIFPLFFKLSPFLIESSFPSQLVFVSQFSQKYHENGAIYPCNTTEN